MVVLGDSGPVWSPCTMTTGASPRQAPMGTRISSVNIWGWAVTRRTNLLKWFNYAHTRAHPGCKVSCHGTEWTCIVGSFMICWGQPDSGESFIVLQSKPTRSLVAKFPQHSVVTCSARTSCCRGRTLRTRHGQVCVNPWCLMSCRSNCIRTIAAIWAQRIYLRIDYARIYGGRFHREPWKNTKLSKLRGGVLAQDNTVTTVTFLTVWTLLVEAIPASMSCQYTSNRNMEFVHNLCCYDNSNRIYLTTIYTEALGMCKNLLCKVFSHKTFIKAHTSIIRPFWSYHCYCNRNILSLILLTLSDEIWPMLSHTDCPINWFSLLTLILEYSLP